MRTPSRLNDPDFNYEQQSNNKRKIVTDIVMHTESKREVLLNVQSLETLGNIPSEQNLHAYASQGNIQVSGSVEDVRLANLSPSKRTAAALEGSPMFAPLEVKFKNLKKIESSAKKQD